MSIYIIAHKKFDKPVLEGYEVLGVGRNDLSGFADCSDHDGADNISEKNGSFCELTGLYWLWKYCEDDFIGICHYRRYFGNGLSSKRYLGAAGINRILKRYDVIVPIHIEYDMSLRDQYAGTSGKASDLVVLGEIIGEMCPSYLNAYNQVLSGNKLYPYNMMVMSNENYKKYCAWLFPLLFECEKRIDISDRSAYEKRLFGFLSERLLNVYLRKNGLKCYECGVINTEDKGSLKVRVKSGVKRELYKLKQGV